MPAEALNLKPATVTPVMVIVEQPFARVFGEVKVTAPLLLVVLLDDLLTIPLHCAVARSAPVKVRRLLVWLDPCLSEAEI